jgi:hypothetical protein
VKTFIISDHLLTQQDMARRESVSQKSIGPLMNAYLDHRKTQKVKLHHVADRTMLQRQNPALPFNYLISEGRYE